MTEKVMISFITPVYNAGAYLCECIDSVLSQTCDSWELILIDDGSTDDSGIICDRYANGDERIKVIHKENSGQFDSRMQGVSAAKGEYCTGLDADDYLEKKCVEKLCAVIKEQKADILCWNIRSVMDGKEVRKDSMPKYGDYGNNEFLRYVAKSTNHSFCNKLIKTELLQKSRFGTIPSKSRHSEDYIMICPSICMAKSIYAIDDVLYNYRQVANSATHVYSLRRVYDYLDSSECVLRIINEYGMLTKDIEKAELSSLVAPVGVCLKKLYKVGDVSNEQIKEVKKHIIYQKLRHYEKLGLATFDVIVFMKLLRYNCDRLLANIYRN